MAASFLDTSALAKLYHSEAGTPFVESLFSQGRSILVSRLCVLEMHSVMAGKVRIRQITPAEMTAVRQRFRSDTRKRRFHVVAIAARHFVRAEALIQDYGEAYGLRALDALQLSVALDLHAHHLIEDFVVADRVLCQVAPMAGLAIINPELTKH